MSTDVAKFSKGYQGKTRRPRRPNRIAQHEGRTPQPGVPTGPRNAPKPTKQERINAAAAAALKVKPLHAPTKAERAEQRLQRQRVEAAAAVLRSVTHAPKLGSGTTSPKVPTLTGRNSGNRSGFAPSKSEALAATTLSDLEKLHAEGKIGKTLGQKITDQVVKYAPVVAPEVAPALEGLSAAVAAARGVRAGDEIVGGSRVLSKVLKPTEATSADDIAAVRARVAEKGAAKEASGVRAAGRRAGERVTRASSRADAALARRVAGRSTRREAAAAVGVPVKVAKVTAAQALPVVRGHEQAIADNPKKVLGTTLRAVPGLVTAPVGQAAALGVAGGRAASEGAHALGIPGARGYTGAEIAAPLVGVAKEQLAFARQVAKTLTSSDSAEVQKAVEDELGLLLPITLGLVGKAAGEKLTKGRITEATRRVVEQARSRVGRAHGAHNGRTPRVLETQGQRKAEAQRIARHKTRSERERRDRTAPILKEARKVKGRAVVRRGVGARHGLRGRRADLEVRGRDVVGFAVRHSLPLDKPDQALAEVKRIGAGLKPLPKGVDLPKDRLNTRDLVAFIEAHPDVLADRHLRTAVDRYRSQAKAARETPGIEPEHSEVARFTPTAVTRGVPLKDERFPSSIRGETRADPERGRPAKDVLRREAKSDRVRSRRLSRKAATREARGRSIAAELKVRERAEPTWAKRNAAVAAKGARLTKQAELYRGGAVKAADLATRKRRASDEIDPAVEAEFLDEMRGRLAAEGKPEPEYVNTGRARQQPTYGATGAKLTNFPGRSKRRRGTADEYGMTDESLQHALTESISRPISRRESYAAMRSFLKENEFRPAGHDGSFDVTSDQARKLFDDHVVSKDRYVLVPRQMFERAYGKFDPEQAAAELRVSLDGDAPGRQFRLVRKPAAEEFFDQLTASFSPKLAKINQVTSGLILRTSPAWAAAQIVAEYAQSAVAQSRVLNPRFVKRVIVAYKALAPHERQAFDSWLGVTTRALESPDDLRQSLGTGDMEAASSAIKAMDRTPLGKVIMSIPNAIGTVDEWKGGRIRMLTAAAKLDADFNRRGGKFLSGIRGLHDELAAASEEMAGMPLDRQMAYMTEHPEVASHVAGYIDDVMGNWSALTRRERSVAGLAIFYPFVRMSLRWVLFAFPRHHPIKAAVLYYLGQANAQQLHELLGRDPSYFSEWASVPLGLGDGKTELIPLSRIAPGSNALVEALGEATDPKEVALRSVQPGIAAAVTALTGVTSSSGKQEPHSAVNALASLMTLSAPGRILDEHLVPGGRRRADGALPFIGGTTRQAALDKLFAKLDQADTATRAARTLAVPMLPERTSYVRDLSKLKSTLKTLEANSTDQRRELGVREEERAEGKPFAQQHKIEVSTAAKASKMTAAYEAAQAELDSLMKKYGVEADEWTGRIYGTAAYGTKPKNVPPPGTLGGKSIRSTTTSASGSPPSAGTLGGRPARGRLQAPTTTGQGRLPAAGTLGGVKVR